MKKLLTILCLLLLSLSSHSRTNRERLFHCRNFGQIVMVEELYIVQTKKGTRTYYEVEVPYNDGVDKTFFRRLNLIKTHGARVLSFTTGNYRVKIDRAMPVEKKYKTFVRLPKFGIHSTEWFCKDY